jgi:hypothetical protein
VVQGNRLHADAGTPRVRFTGRTPMVSDLDVERCLLRIDASVVEDPHQEVAE